MTAQKFHIEPIVMAGSRFNFVVFSPNPVQFLRHQNMVNMTQESETWPAHSSLDSLGLPSLTHIFEKYHLVIQHSSGNPHFWLGDILEERKKQRLKQAVALLLFMHVVIVYLPGAQEMWQAPILFKESHGDLGYPYFRKHIYIYIYMAF